MKEINRIIGLIALLLLLVSGVSAISDIGVFKQGEVVQLIQICDSCSFVNLDSVSLPDGEIIIFNESMTRASFTYNFSFSDTSQLGVYTYFVCGDKSVLVCESLTFEVTPSGFISSLSSLSLIFGFSIIIIAFALVGFFGGQRLVKDESGKESVKQLLGVKFFGYGVALIELLLLIFLLYLQSLGVDVSVLLNVNFKVLMVLIGFIGLTALFLFMLKLMNPSDDLKVGDRKW